MKNMTIKSRRRCSPKLKIQPSLEATPPPAPTDRKQEPQKSKRQLKKEAWKNAQLSRADGEPGEQQPTVNTSGARRGGAVEVHWSRVEGSGWTTNEVHERGRALMKRKQIADAKALFEAALQEEKSHTREAQEAKVYTRVLLSQAYEREGDYEGCLAEMQRAAEGGKALGMAQGSPICFVIHSLIQRNAAEVGGPHLAVGLASTALLKPGLLEQNSFDMARVCMVECSLYRQLGQLARARDACQEAIDAGSAAGHKPGGFRRVQEANEATLRDLQIALGEVDLEAEGKEEEARQANRERRARRAIRLRAEQSRAMDSQLVALAPEVAARRRVVPGLCRGEEGALPGSRLPWDSLPASLLPSSTEDGGLSHNENRVQRKQWQLESLYTVLRRVVQSLTAQYPKPCCWVPQSPPATIDEQPARKKAAVSRDLAADPIHVVDFGSGSGNSVLAFAALLPRCRFTLVDNNPFCAELGAKRVARAGLTNVDWVVGDVADFEPRFDIGLATHLCGGASDVAQAKAMRHGAVFVLTPCCMGKIRHAIKRDYQSVHQQRRNANRKQQQVEELGNEPMGVLEEAILNHQGDAPEPETSQDKKAVQVPSQPSDTAIVMRAAGAGDAIEGGTGMVYPRSAWLRGELPLEDYLEIIRLSDHSSHAAGEAYTASKRLIDADRCTAAAEAGYKTVVGQLWPPEASPKNDVLVGAPVGLGLVGWLE